MGFQLIVSPQRLNKLISHQPEVGRELKNHANRIAGIARGVLSEHRHSGDARITVTHGSVDWFVSLDDTRGQRAAAAIEFGHTAPNGRFVPGVHALTRSFK